MKVAYLTSEFLPIVYGGLGIYVDEMGRALTRMGEDITAFTFGDGKIPEYEDMGGVHVRRLTPTVMLDGFKPFLSQETLGWGDGMGYLFNMFALNQASVEDVKKSGPYDLAIAHDWLSLPAGMALKKTGMPMIYHVHSLEVVRTDHPSAQITALEMAGAAAADIVIAVSYNMKKKLIEMGVEPGKIRVAHHGANLELFNQKNYTKEQTQALRDKYGIKSTDVVGLFVGRLESLKGVTQMFDALPEVFAKNPDFHLVVLGKGSLEGWTQEQAKKYPGKITLISDFLDDGPKVLHFAMADMYVFPSLWEPFGIVGVEAAAMGKPAVVGAQGVSGLAEIVIPPHMENPTGVHVNSRDPHDIAWGINLVLEDKERMRQWGKNARRRAEECFTWEYAAEKTLGFYKEAIR